MLFYNLIPKGGAFAPPFDNPPLYGNSVLGQKATKDGGSQRGHQPPLELNYIYFSPSRTARVQILSKLALREGAGGG